jgi:hypothetical protein
MKKNNSEFFEGGDVKLHHFMYNFNKIFHIALYNSFNGVLQMLQRRYSAGIGLHVSLRQMYIYNIYYTEQLQLHLTG